MWFVAVKKLADFVVTSESGSIVVQLGLSFRREMYFHAIHVRIAGVYVNFPSVFVHAGFLPLSLHMNPSPITHNSHQPMLIRPINRHMPRLQGLNR